MLEVEFLRQERWKMVRHFSEFFLGTRPKGEMRRFFKKTGKERPSSMAIEDFCQKVLFKDVRT